ncbi:MAG: serine/threonine protein kinase [Anaerolineae bacterium]
MTVPCPNCGRLNRPGARYCAACQTPLGGAPPARLHSGQVLDGGAYRVVRPLGKGGMGAVWLVAQTKAFDRLAVLKEVVEYYDPTDAAERERALDRFEAEARTLGDLKHPGIPDLYAYFSERGHNYLVMEYIEGPDLRQGLTREDGDTGQLIPGGPFPPDAVLRYAMQVCEVLEYLASRQPPVIHNDIKPGNVIIDENSGRAVLVDFGTAKTRYLKALGDPDGRRPSLYGTVGYAAPELFKGHSEPRSDVYSLAATAYHLLTDDDPRDHPMQYPLLDTLPPSLADILRGALAEEPGERPSAAELRQQLGGYLAGLTGPLRGLTFPDGEVADERDELLSLAVKHWSYAAGILQDGTMAHWLRRALHDPVAAQAAEQAVQRWPTSPDAALDEFVRSMAPAMLPPGKLEMHTTSIRLPRLGANQQITQQIEIANLGRGYLRGSMLSTQPWLQVDSTGFACPPGQVCQVPIEIDTRGLDPGRAYLGAVTLTPVGGTPEVVAVQIAVDAQAGAPVRITTDPPVVQVSPGRLDFGSVSRRDPVPAQRLTVSNGGQAMAQVHVRDVPRWLHVEPSSFSLVRGARQPVEVRARPDKARRGAQRATLIVAVDGGADQLVEVALELKRRGLFG